MTDVELPRVIAVRHGQVSPAGSWLYAWIDIATGEVAYVGATGFDPDLRIHLHLHSEDPSIARVRTLATNALERDFDVLVFPLPESAARPAHKQALRSALAAAGLLPQSESSDELDEPLLEIQAPLIVTMVSAVSRYVARITGDTGDVAESGEDPA